MFGTEEEPSIAGAIQTLERIPTERRIRLALPHRDQRRLQERRGGEQRRVRMLSLPGSQPMEQCEADRERTEEARRIVVRCERHWPWRARSTTHSRRHAGRRLRVRLVAGHALPRTAVTTEAHRAVHDVWS